MRRMSGGRKNGKRAREVTEKAPIEIPEEWGKYVDEPFTLFSHILILRMIFMEMRNG
jgi:hypothetical protein